MLVSLGVIFAVQCVMLVIIGCFLSHRSAKAIRDALKDPTTETRDRVAIERVQSLLMAANQALAEHSNRLHEFEHSLDTRAAQAGGGRSRYFTQEVGQMREANRRVEETVEETVDALIAACGSTLSEEQSQLQQYQDKTADFDRRLATADREMLLTGLATKLLEMVHELREENKTVRNEVASSQDKIIQLMTRASSAEHIARVDALTQLSNRRAFEEAHAHCEETLLDTGQPYCLIMLDIDHFKLVNDRYGHAAGDAILSLIGRVLRENCKTSDTVCRLGGEEFAILLPRCEEKTARILAERYRRKIESATLRFDNQQLSVTVSCGVAQAAPGKIGSLLLERADAALYAAKTRGRNQTCTDHEADGEPASQGLTAAT